MTSPSGSPLFQHSSNPSGVIPLIQQSIPLSSQLPRFGSAESPTSTPSFPRKGIVVKADPRVDDIEKRVAEERKKQQAELEKERTSYIECMQQVVNLKQSEQTHLKKIKELQELIGLQRDVSLKTEAELKHVQQELEEAKAKNASEGIKLGHQLEANVRLLDEKEKSLQEILKKNEVLEQAISAATLECYNTFQAYEKQKFKHAELEEKVRSAEESSGITQKLRQELKDTNERYEKIYRLYEIQKETEKHKDQLIAELQDKIAASAQPIIANTNTQAHDPITNAQEYDALKQRVQELSSTGYATPNTPTATSPTPTTEPPSGSRSPFLSPSPASSIQSTATETTATAEQESKEATIEKQEQMISTLRKTLYVVLGILVLIAIGAALCFLFPSILALGAAAVTNTWQFILALGSRTPQVLPDFTYYALRGIGI